MNRQDTPQEPRYLGLTPTQFNIAFFLVLGTGVAAVAIYLGALSEARNLIGEEEPPSSSAAVATETPMAMATPGATPTSTAMTAQEAADYGLLTLDDLPIGWAPEAPEDDDDSDIDLGEEELSEDCAAMAELESFPEELASAESEDLEGPSSQTVSSSVSVFSSEAATEEALEMFDEAMTNCRADFVALFEESVRQAAAEEGDPSQVRVEASMYDLAFPHMGDQAEAHRLGGTVIVEGVTVEFALDFVAIREGRMGGLLTYFAMFGIDSGEETSLAEKFAGKLETANGLLES